MRSKGRVATLAATAMLALGTGVAWAGTMHPELGAQLAGMGQKGSVDLQLNEKKGEICWTFHLTTKGITGASIRDTGGMVVAKLGSAYHAKDCGMVAKHAISLIESKPASYRVWVDTKGHPGELRGKLFVGMARM